MKVVAEYGNIIKSIRAESAFSWHSSGRWANLTLTDLCLLIHDPSMVNNRFQIKRSIKLDKKMIIYTYDQYLLHSIITDPPYDFC
jgi:hypothetical protein